MPSSSQNMLPDMVTEIVKTNPNTILDIGIGYGKYAFLSREYLESHRDRVYPEQWQVWIEGIEIWEDYINKLPWLRLLYNTIHKGDACQVIDSLSDYDLIIASEVLEHMTKIKGEKLLRKCIKKSKKCCLVTVPTGQGWMGNKIVAGNTYESHQAIWSVNDLVKIGQEELGYTIQTMKWMGARGDGAIAIYRRK